MSFNFTLKRLIINVENFETLYLENEQRLRELMLKIALLLKCDVLDMVIHKFEPQGYSAVAIISASTIAIHTYPEKDFISIDIHTCNHDTNTKDIIKNLYLILRNIIKTAYLYYNYSEYEINEPNMKDYKFYGM